MKNDVAVGHLTRRNFARKLGVVGSVLIAAPPAALVLPSESLGEPTVTSRPSSQSDKAAELWNVRLAEDGRHIELSYRGKAWLKQFRLRLKLNRNSFSSNAPQARLRLTQSANGQETVARVQGPQVFEIVFSPQNSILVISVRDVQGPGIAAVHMEAEVEAGSDPVQARLAEVHDDIQQMVSGGAVSSLNDCVFDRFRDQALRVNARYWRFAPITSGFRLTAGTTGTAAPVCSLEICERVYESRLRFYAPFDKERWPKPPLGWCSFHYYGNVLSEQDILRNSKALAQSYADFGLEYVLIDGGWQASGISGNWTTNNDNFSHGMKWLAANIRAVGLRPAVWLSEFGTDDEAFYKAHRGWFLHDAEGNAKLGTWFGTYILDFSNPEVKQYLRQIYRMMTVDWDYDYFKLDGENATRNIWGQNRRRAYNPAQDADTAFREGLEVIREALDSKPGTFLSACGPVYPTESIGIAQSARLGQDILSFSPSDPSSKHSEKPSFRCVRTALEGMRQGYYTHNIAWYGDPDGVLLRPPLTEEEARTWFSILGLTGQLLMLGDDMTALSEERRDIARKCMPIVDIKPMELYPQSTTPHRWVLHMKRAFGVWAVVGLFNWDYNADEVPSTFVGGEQNSAFWAAFHHDAKLLGTDASDRAHWTLAEDPQGALGENKRLESLPDKPAGLELLPVPAYLAPPPPRGFAFRPSQIGLPAGQEYLLFDFWKQQFIGRLRGEEKHFVKLEPHACQILSVRTANGRPQTIGTDRHITVGGVELQNEGWDSASQCLMLSVHLIRKYATKLTVYKGGKHFVKVRVADADIKAVDNPETVELTLERSTTGTTGVIIQFS